VRNWRSLSESHRGMEFLWNSHQFQKYQRNRFREWAPSMGMFQPSSASAHKCRRRYLCLTFESHRPKHIDFKVNRRPLPSISLYAQCSRVCFRKKLRLISSRFERQSFWNYVKEMVEVRKVKKGLPLAKEVQARAYFIYQVVQKTFTY